MHDAVALGDAAAARAVHADRMDLVDIGHGAVALGEIADLRQRRDVAVHRIEALAGDQLRPVGTGGAQQFFQMRHVVVAEDLALAAGLADAFDHRIVVERVRQDQAVRNQLGDGRDAGLVRDIARGEQQRGLLAVQVGQFLLRAAPADDGCRRCCGCRRRRCRRGWRSRPWRRPPSGAGPCRDSRWSTRSRRCAGPSASARPHAGTGRRSARDRRKRGSAARHAGG